MHMNNYIGDIVNYYDIITYFIRKEKTNNQIISMYYVPILNLIVFL